MFHVSNLKKDMGDNRIKLRKKLFFLTFVPKILIVYLLLGNYSHSITCAVIDISNLNTNSKDDNYNYNNINKDKLYLNNVDTNVSNNYQIEDDSDKNLNLINLPKLILEGLGLTRMPDVSKMNISQTEYLTKYNEYLRRVNERHRREMLTSAASDQFPFSSDAALADVDHMELYTFSANNSYDYSHLYPRQHRNRIKRGTDFNELIFLRFELPSPNDLPNIIDESSLNVMLMKKNKYKINYSNINSYNTNTRNNSNTNSKNFNSTTNASASANANSSSKNNLGNKPQSTKNTNINRNRSRNKKLKDTNSNSNSNNFRDNNLNSNNHNISIHVYQLIEPYDRILIKTEKIHIGDMKSTNSRWIQLDVNAAVLSWLNGERKNLGLEIVCENCNKYNIHIIHDADDLLNDGSSIRNDKNEDEGQRSQENLNPVLNIVGNMIPREKRSKIEKTIQIQPSTDHQPPHHHHHGRKMCQAKDKRCCRHSLMVTLSDIKDFRYIVQPKSFDFGYCRGRCPVNYKPATHHALLQSLLAREDKYKHVPKVCCVPSRLVDIDVLHVDENDPAKLVVSTLTNIKVMECACT